MTTAELKKGIYRLVLEYRTRQDGGPGSGNFGHKGVPGQIGGSAPSVGEKLSKDEIASIRKFSGDHRSLNEKETADIERAIAKSYELDNDVDYSRGIALKKEALDRLIDSGVYQPDRL